MPLWNIVFIFQNDGITVEEINYSEGKVSCRLERNVSVMTGGKVFDVTQTDYYMFFARGPLVDGKQSTPNVGSIRYHAVF